MEHQRSLKRNCWRLSRTTLTSDQAALSSELSSSSADVLLVSFSSSLNTHLLVLHITEQNVSGIMALSMYKFYWGGGWGGPH